jgi:AbrB family looped-hinge helix DNA binding protein
MRITSQGQVTIPADILEKAGIQPDTEVELAYEGDGRVVLFQAKKAESESRPGAKSRGEMVVEHLRRFGREHPINMTTDEIMALTRGED